MTKPQKPFDGEIVDINAILGDGDADSAAETAEEPEAQVELPPEIQIPAAAPAEPQMKLSDMLASNSVTTDAPASEAEPEMDPREAALIAALAAPPVQPAEEELLVMDLAAPESDAPVQAPPTKKDYRPVPESQLTEQEKRIRQLEDELARRKAADLENSPIEFDTMTEGQVIQIHFVADGFTYNGVVWYRGQQIDFVVGSEAYRDTFDRNGDSWLRFATDEFAQMEQFGEVKFRRGPWRGKDYEIEAAAQAEARRHNAAPVVHI